MTETGITMNKETKEKALALSMPTLMKPRLSL